MWVALRARGDFWVFVILGKNIVILAISCAGQSFYIGPHKDRRAAVFAAAGWLLGRILLTGDL